MRNTLVLLGSILVLGGVLAGWTLMQATAEEEKAIILHADGAWTTSRASSEAQKTVVLRPDGTWAYREPPQAALPSVTSYSKPVSATSFVKGEAVPYGIWIDARTWRRDAEALDNVLERRFTHASGEAWGAVIAESTRLSFDYVKEFVLQSARKHMADAEIVWQEQRMINGHEVMFLNIQGKYRSAPFTYLNYYYIGEEGTVQIYTWTLQKLAGKYERDMLNFLNGFEINGHVN